MSSAICFNLDQSKVLLSGNGLSNSRYMVKARLLDFNCFFFLNSSVSNKFVHARSNRNILRADKGN